MTGEEIKAVVRRIYEEVFNQGNLALVDELFAPDFVDHFADPLPFQPTTTPEAVRWFAGFVRDAFPDLKVTVDDMIVEGDQLAARATWRGTHQHQFGYIPPTGKRITMESVDMARVVDGRITEHWGGWNFESILRQLGALPEPEGTQG